MNRLLKLSLLSLCLTGSSFGAASEAPQKATDSAVQEKRDQKKLERAKHLLEINLKEYAELEPKVTGEKDAKRQKKAIAARKHAEIELNLAQDPELADDMLWHVRQTKRYLQRTKNILDGKAEQFREKRKKMAEMRATKADLSEENKAAKAS